MSASCASSVGGERELRLEVLGELAPHLLAREELVERARARAALVGSSSSTFLYGGDGVLGPAEPLVVDLRHRARRAPRGVRASIGLLDAALR